MKITDIEGIVMVMPPPSNIIFEATILLSVTLIMSQFGSKTFSQFGTRIYPYYSPIPFILTNNPQQMESGPGHESCS